MVCRLHTLPYATYKIAFEPTSNFINMLSPLKGPGVARRILQRIFDFTDPG